MTCIVLDDEEMAIDFIVERNIKKVPFLSLVGVFTDPNEALLFLQTNTVDLIFLDIEMPNYEIDGIDFMKLMKPDQRYILITAHPEYALESYEFNVAYYLPKPFSFDRFVKGVQKAQLQLKPVEPGNKPDEAGKREDLLFLRSNKKLQRVLIKSIVYVEADRNYATIFRADDQIATKTTLSKLEGELPASQFCRVHKSYIVGLDNVEFVEKDQIGVNRAEEVIKIPLSSQYKKTFLQSIERRALT